MRQGTLCAVAIKTKLTSKEVRIGNSQQLLAQFNNRLASRSIDQRFRVNLLAQ